MSKELTLRERIEAVEGKLGNMARGEVRGALEEICAVVKAGLPKAEAVAEKKVSE